MAATHRVALAARVFALAGVLSVAVLLGSHVVRGALIVLVVGIWAQLFSATGRLSEGWLASLEGAVVGLLAAALWPHNDAVIPYLLVPALVGGLASGMVGVLRVLAAEGAVTAAAWWLLVDHVDRGVLASVLMWFITGLGLGMLGVSFRRTASATSGDGAYRDALQLIKRLHALSGRLTFGLDAVSLAEQALGLAANRLQVSQAAVMVETDAGSFTPLRFSDGADPFTLSLELDWVKRAADACRSLIRGHRVALPLCSDGHAVAVLVADCLDRPDPRTVAGLETELAPKAIQLNAALIFGAVRDAATSEERQRLAREVHDGVAQDVASLGYLIDNLTESAVDPDQQAGLDQLRNEVTRVVGELRHSVFDLRNEVGTGQGLGQSISSFARHIGSHSDLTVHVTLDEAPTRLRPELESELLRIAQEAINNARKHSKGQNLWVSCTVRPPTASIEIRDDGAGLGHGRADSHGLRIMRERADLIGACLSVETPTGGGDHGTRVTVRLPAPVNDASDRWMVHA